MKTFLLIAATLSLLGINGCSTVGDQGGMEERAAPANSTAQAAPPQARTPWGYHSYPFGE